jgi:anhydro-N-acetylmuramic acid kinase
MRTILRYAQDGTQPFYYEKITVMTTSQPAWYIGLMSGTSMDGVDAALLQTDGRVIQSYGPAMTLPYPPQFRTLLAQCMGDFTLVPEVEDRLTRYHAEAVKQVLAKANMQPGQVKAVGFHGQTILHKPRVAKSAAVSVAPATASLQGQHGPAGSEQTMGLTWQIGNGALLANLTGIDVVNDFRRNDIALGGQGAPLVPVFHLAVASQLECPAVLVNIGGIANITYVGDGQSPEKLWGFDTGPGNRLIDRWVEEKSGLAYDAGGDLALRGTVDETALAKLMQHPGICAAPPKSFDTADFDLSPVAHLSVEDGAATLAAFTADAIASHAEYFSPSPRQWLLCGGGRLNRAILERLKGQLQSVKTVDELGLDGDALEAYAFAYLAARSLQGLPLTFPNTTGVSRAATGGAFYRAGHGGSE